MVKRFLKSSFAAGAVSFLIRVYLRLVRMTSSVNLVDLKNYEDALAEGNGVLLAFWHGRLALMPFIRDYTDADVYMLISNHRDGEMIANGVKGFGLKFIRGSSDNKKKAGTSKGGASAIAQMMAALKDGQAVGVTPDGPRGPRDEAQAGGLKIAPMANAAIIPVGASASRGRRFNSWDRFLAPAPFSKYCFVVGQPLRVPHNIGPEDVAALRAALNDAINDVTARADELCGRRTDLNEAAS